MAKGDTRPPAHFNDAADPAPARAARVQSYPCFADGCPMPGTIFLGGSDRGSCAWHFGCNGDEIPRVTEAIQRWECVSRAVNGCRSFTNDPLKATASKGEKEAFLAAWELLLPAVLGSGWKPRLEPREGERYGEWGRRLERFLRNRIKETLGGMVVADDDQPTQLVADMLTRVTGAVPRGAW